MSSFNKFVIKSKPQKEISAGVYAAALQDHLSRDKNLNKILSKPSSLLKNPLAKPKTGPKYQLPQLSASTRNQLGLSKPRPTKKENQVQPRSLQSIASTTNTSTRTSSTLSSIGGGGGISIGGGGNNNLRQKQKNFLEELREQNKKLQVSEKNANTVKLKNYMNKLTLAQRLGLVQKPPKPLTNDQWVEIEEKSKERVDDHKACPICLEGFKTPNNQVILSCSHVFHKNCLSNFEKYAQVKMCPLCRRRDYEKKNFDNGFVLYVESSAVKIQSRYKGYITRKKLYTRWNREYKARSTYFKRRLLGFKLRMLSERMERKVKQKQKETTQILEEIDTNLEKNAKLMEKLMQAEGHRIANQQRANVEIQQKLQDQGAAAGKVAEVEILLQSEKWRKVYEKASIRNDQSCPICFNQLGNQKKLTLLDCSHVFHECCLSSFEYYDLSSSHNCPCCRHKYTRINIQGEQAALPSIKEQEEQGQNEDIEQSGGGDEKIQQIEYYKEGRS